MDFISGQGWAKEKEWSLLHVGDQRRFQNRDTESRYFVFVECHSGTTLETHTWRQRYELNNIGRSTENAFEIDVLKQRMI